ncbi:HNH endonuclease [Streptomyces vinaceus]|uniref:HNH endonuclease n=1 Tax=Streptomyces vinaceus TaxID=1960 RepID=UPI00368759D4
MVGAKERAEEYLDSAILNGDCLEHGGYSGDRGYVTVRFRGKNYKAHRFIYHNLCSELGPGDVVHHKCSNRSCINPEHLQVVTASENTAEMLERNTYLRRIRQRDVRIEELEVEIAELKAMVVA